MLAGFLGVSTAQSISLAEDVDIEMASGELSEQQCQEVSLKVDLDMRAPVQRVLDFMEEVSWHQPLGRLPRNRFWQRQGGC